MTTPRFSLALLGSLLALSAQANLLNISTNNLQSATSTASGCSIIEAGGLTSNGEKYMVVLAESLEDNSDSVLTVRDLKGLNTWTNDDWQGARYLNGQQLGGSASDAASIYSQTISRLPGRGTDAAILVRFKPGEAICAYSKEKSTGNLKAVSIAITDVTQNALKALELKAGGPSLLEVLSQPKE